MPLSTVVQEFLEMRFLTVYFILRDFTEDKAYEKCDKRVS